MGATDDIGYTPLHHSALRADVEMVSLLIQAGVNVNVADDGGYTPLHWAARGRFSTARAIDSRALECVKLLLRAGAAVNARARGGCTPLHEAVRSRVGSNVDCVDLLLKAGADRSVNVEGHGWTPLALALNGGHRRMWPLLLRAGAGIPGYYSPMPNPYLLRVQGAGGFKKYEQAHLARLTAILETPLLPPELVRKIIEFWLHAGYY